MSSTRIHIYPFMDCVKMLGSDCAATQCMVVNSSTTIHHHTLNTTFLLFPLFFFPKLTNHCVVQEQNFRQFIILTLCHNLWFCFFFFLNCGRIDLKLGGLIVDFSYEGILNIVYWFIVAHQRGWRYFFIYKQKNIFNTWQLAFFFSLRSARWGLCLMMFWRFESPSKFEGKEHTGGSYFSSNKWR